MVKMQPTEKGVFVLKVFQKRHHLEISALESSQMGKGPFRDFQEHPFSKPEVTDHYKTVIELSNRSNRSGKLSSPDLKRLKAVGQLLYDDLLPLTAKQRLNSTKAEYLILDVDDKLNYLPWELLFDGSQFLCLKFNMGRIVRTKNDPQMLTPTQRKFTLPLKMLILFDPQGNLQCYYGEDEPNEGELILKTLAQQEMLVIEYKCGPIDSNYVRMYLRDYDIVHYAGHGEYNFEDPAKSGWLLADRKLLAADIIKMQGNEKLLPALIFCNACQSGITGKWKTAHVYDLAKSYLLTGVQHYIGTQWEILNKPSSHFALAFYSKLIQERSIGEALKSARQSLISVYGEETIVWASYILYGDPTINYINIAREAEIKAGLSDKTPVKLKPEAGPIPIIEPSSRLSPITKTAYTIGSGIVLAAMFAMLIATHLRRHQESPALKGKYELALSYIDAGDYEAARKISREIKALSPQAAYGYIISGNMLFNQGDMEDALLEYTQAAQTSDTTPQERALAYNRLGQIYHKQEKDDLALMSYDQAQKLNSRNPQLYTNKGVILRQIGNYSAAQEQFARALELDPQDRLAALFKADVEQRIAEAENSARQERVGKLINDLVAAYHQQKPLSRAEQKGADEPLTVTFLDFKSQGVIPAREGENEYILLKVMDYLRDSGKVQIVERQLLERLLEELKLGSSELADPKVSARLGRILAARLIITGSIIRNSKDIQIGTRLIETETTAIHAALALNLDKKVPLDEIAQRLAQEIMRRI
jgi:CHAT domain-containing protein/Flp pilus assembly protein TadD